MGLVSGQCVAVVDMALLEIPDGEVSVSGVEVETNSTRQEKSLARIK